MLGADLPSLREIKQRIILGLNSEKFIDGINKMNELFIFNLSLNW